MAEFGLKTIVLIADSTGALIDEQTVADLLPGAFSAADLGTS